MADSHATHSNAVESTRTLNVHRQLDAVHAEVCA
jgi:hypothetical protein